MSNAGGAKVEDRGTAPPRALVRQLEPSETVIWWSAGSGLDLRIKTWAPILAMIVFAGIMISPVMTNTWPTGTGLVVVGFLGLVGFFLLTGYALFVSITCPSSSLYCLTDRRVIVRFGNLPPQWQARRGKGDRRYPTIERVEVWSRFGNRGVTIYSDRLRGAAPLDFVGIDDPPKVADLVCSTLEVDRSKARIG